MFDRHQGGETVVLMHIDTLSSEEALLECHELAKAAGLKVLGEVRSKRKKIDARFFIGRGKADELKEKIEAQEISLIIVNHAISAIQERNLEQYCCCRVLDRSSLILDIFASRARSYEGRIQVELAQLKHLSTRLVRGWTHLERQKGGIGLRGPGETQLETDRRLLAQRVKNLQKRLLKVEAQRSLGRQSRRKSAIDTVAFVGYTNAGKSTLFNQLTGAGVLSSDQVFATLDPTLRRLGAGGKGIVLADTVGFVQDLPHELVAAFKATLQEAREAELLVHVVDAASASSAERITQVNSVLKSIGAADVPQLLVYNKIDQCDLEPRVRQLEDGTVDALWLSALEGTGCDALVGAMQSRLDSGRVKGWMSVPFSQARLRARLFELEIVLEELVDEHNNWVLKVEMSRQQQSQLATEFGNPDLPFCSPDKNSGAEALASNSG